MCIPLTLNEMIGKGAGGREEQKIDGKGRRRNRSDGKRGLREDRSEEEERNGKRRREECSIII